MWTSHTCWTGIVWGTVSSVVAVFLGFTNSAVVIIGIIAFFATVAQKDEELRMHPLVNGINSN